MKEVQGNLEGKAASILSREASNLKLVLSGKDVHIEIFEKDGESLEVSFGNDDKVLLRSDKMKTKVSKQRLIRGINEGVSLDLSLGDLENKGTLEALLEIKSRIAKNSQ